MPRVEIPVQTITRLSVAPGTQVDGDATNDHYIADNDGRVFVEVVSTAIATESVIFETPYTLDALDLENQTVYVGPSATRLAGPWPTSTFNQTGSGDENKLFLNPSVSTTLKFRAYRI
jgi:hypothetical protein